MARKSTHTQVSVGCLCACACFPLTRSGFLPSPMGSYGPATYAPGYAGYGPGPAVGYSPGGYGASYAPPPMYSSGYGGAPAYGYPGGDAMYSTTPTSPGLGGLFCPAFPVACAEVAPPCSDVLVSVSGGYGGYGGYASTVPTGGSMGPPGAGDAPGVAGTSYKVPRGARYIGAEKETRDGKEVIIDRYAVPQRHVQQV